MRSREGAGGRGRAWRRARWAVGGLVGVAVGLAALWQALIGENFAEVDPGLVYRSAQPDGNLGDLLGRCRPASILNLRGGSTADPWYEAEVRATDRDGIDFYDLPLKAERRPSRRELLTLLDLFDRCRYPLLIHCKSGSDRTGLASGLYLMARKGQAPEQAERALSTRHGHVPLLGTQHLHEPFDEYAAWLKGRRLAHSPALFRAWVERDYRDAEAAAPISPLRPGPRLRAAVESPARR